jgi:hypothetical protein
MDWVAGLPPLETLAVENFKRVTHLDPLASLTSLSALGVEGSNPNVDARIESSLGEVQDQPAGIGEGEVARRILGRSCISASSRFYVPDGHCRRRRLVREELTVPGKRQEPARNLRVAPAGYREEFFPPGNLEDHDADVG